MRAAILNLDDALEGQTALHERLQAEDVVVVEADDIGPSLRLWARPDALKRLSDRVRMLLPARRGPQLVFAGSGDFHHATPTLLTRALEIHAGPVCVLHIDNHPDWVRFGEGLHCGSWVGTAARTPGVERVVTVGVCSADVGAARMREGDLALVRERRHILYAYRAPQQAQALEIAGESRPTIEALGLAGFIDRVLDDITTRAVYVTIDKDALRPEDAATNWDQGRMSADELLAILTAVGQRHELIGADVVGDWSPPAYGGSVWARAMKRGEALLDQPWRSPVDADRINQATNLRLLDFFAKAA